jgi:hypothetical protein
MKRNIPDDVAISFFVENIESSVKSGSGYVGRCPVCGDSQKNSSKKRLYLLYKEERGWGIYCHNCELSQGLYYFVQDYFPQLLSHFKTKCFKEYIISKKKSNEESDKEENDALSLAIKKKLSKKKIVESTSNVEDSTEYSDNDALSLAIKRKLAKKKSPIKELPKKSKIEKFYDSCELLSDSMKAEVSKRNLSKEMIDSLRYCRQVEDNRLMGYKDRIIIPFYNKKNQLYYFQARATNDKQDPKYLNWYDDTLDHKPEYNECNVDRTIPVYIVEGLFDSTFVENAVSTLGVKFSYEKLLYLEEKYPKGVYCLDNDETAYIWTKKLLKENKTCLVFPPKYKNIKDLNDISIYDNINNLTEFVRENSYKGVKGLLKLQQLMRS